MYKEGIRHTRYIFIHFNVYYQVKSSVKQKKQASRLVPYAFSFVLQMENVEGQHGKIGAQQEGHMNTNI